MTVTNTGSTARRLTITSYVEWVLGVNGSNAAACADCDAS